MRISTLCYGCVYCQTCDKDQEQKCANEHYILFTTEEQAKICELMGCYEAEEDDCN